MNPIDMTKFRKRIGEKGAEKIFKISLMVNAKEITEKEMKLVMIDCTVQEMARNEDIELRRTYTRELKALKLKVRFMNHPTRMKEGKKAVKRIRTIARAMVSDIAFLGKPYGGHTVSAHLEQIRRLTDHIPEEAVTDRGYRGKKEVGRTKICIPCAGTPGQSYYQKTKSRKKFQKRAGIEPVIGHLKSDHRMIRNYLKGTLGDAINTLMAAAAYNMRHWMNKNALSSFVSWLKTVVEGLENMLFGSENQYARQNSNLAIVAR